MDLTETTIAEKVYLFENDKRTKEQKYEAIVNSIRQMYVGKKDLSQTELHDAANRVIEFVTIMLKVSQRSLKNGVDLK